MPLSLDHIFIITKPGAAVADQLVDLGFIEGTSNTHPGQGTANRRFFFNDFTIELLYVSDAHEAANGAGSRLGILERSQNSLASPFGLIVRVSEFGITPHFPSWQYFPDYFNGKMSFYVGENSNNLQEPLCICMPPSLPKSNTIPSELSNPNWILTTIEIGTPVASPSPTLAHFQQVERVMVRHATDHHMTLTFNNAVADQSKELSPLLPLTVRW